MIYKNVNEYFKYLRQKNDLTQQQVADYMKYSSPQLVSNWERNICSAPRKQWRKLCKFFNGNPNVLILDAQDDHQDHLRKLMRL